MGHLGDPTLDDSYFREVTVPGTKGSANRLTRDSYSREFLQHESPQKETAWNPAPHNTARVAAFGPECRPAADSCSTNPHKEESRIEEFGDPPLPEGNLDPQTQEPARVEPPSFLNHTSWVGL